MAWRTCKRQAFFSSLPRSDPSREGAAAKKDLAFMRSSAPITGIKLMAFRNSVGAIADRLITTPPALAPKYRPLKRHGVQSYGIDQVLPPNHLVDKAWRNGLSTR